MKMGSPTPFTFVCRNRGSVDSCYSTGDRPVGAALCCFTSGPASGLHLEPQISGIRGSVTCCDPGHQHPPQSSDITSPRPVREVPGVGEDLNVSCPPPPPSLCGCKDALTGSGLRSCTASCPPGLWGQKGECQVGHETQLLAGVLAASSSIATSVRLGPQRQELLPVARPPSTPSWEPCPLGPGQAQRLAWDPMGDW